MTHQAQISTQNYYSLPRSSYMYIDDINMSCMRGMEEPGDKVIKTVVQEK